MLLIGWLVALLGVMLGLESARRIFQEDRLLALLFVGPGLGVVHLLLAGTYLRGWLSPDTATVLTGVLWAVLLLALRRYSAPPLVSGPISRTTALFLVAGSFLVVLYALFEKTTGMVVDGDFFIHVASIGLFQEGHYPPVNPFLGIPTEGHFGTQLLVAQFGLLTGLHFLDADWILTTLLQLLSFGTLFCLVESNTKSSAQAMLATGLAFFGANFGSRIGLVDTLANHNATAFFFFLICTWSIFRSVHRSYVVLLAAGVVLGTDALVYETHFGLMGLTLPLLFLNAQELGWKTKVQKTLGLGLFSLLIASTTGGVVTGAVKHVLQGDLNERNAQQQQVTVRFPKDKIFQVRRDNLRPSRPFEGGARPWGADFQASNDYASLLSAPILNTFWYPVWFYPLTFGLLVWKRSASGIWFGSIGLLAALVPGVVDFGFFEGEASRWLFVTNLGGTICFGLALGDLWDRQSRRWPKTIVLATVLAFCGAGFYRSAHDLAPALRNPGSSLPIGRPGVVPGVGLVPEPFRLLAHHYQLQNSDFQAAEWLRENSSPDDRFLIDDDHLRYNAKAAMIGLAGRLPAAYLPQVVAATEPSSYRRRLQIDQFWRTGDPRLLIGLDVDWVVVHTSQHKTAIMEAIWGSDILEKKVRFGEVEIFEVKFSEQELEWTVETPVLKQISWEATPKKGVASLAFESPLKSDWLTVWFRHKELDTLVGGPQWLTAGKRVQVVLPHEQGVYEVWLVGGRSPVVQGDMPPEALKVGQVVLR